jgi:spore coat protein U-like protein
MMIRTLPLVLLFLSAAGVAAAQTQDTSQQRVLLAGNAPSVCKMDAPTSGGGGTVQFSVSSSNAAELNFQALANPTTAVAQAAQVTVSFPVICTGAHSLTVSSTNGGLTNPALPATGFATRVDYALTAQWAADQRRFQTVGSPTSLNLTESDGVAGNLTVAIAIANGVLPLVSGAYTDQVVVQFSATP